MKTITMTDLKNTIGKVRHEITEHQESYTITFQGRPIARLVPVQDDDVTVIHSDGSIIGKPPLTMRRRL